MVLCGCDIKRQGSQISGKGDPHVEADWLFEKKFRCAQIKGPFAKEVGGQVDEIFYSPKLNTCVATVQSTWGDKSIVFSIKDALTGKTLFISGNIYGRTEAELHLTDRVNEFR
jgi:ribosomal protein L2